MRVDMELVCECNEGDLDNDWHIAELREIKPDFVVLDVWCETCGEHTIRKYKSFSLMTGDKPKKKVNMKSKVEGMWVCSYCYNDIELGGNPLYTPRKVDRFDTEYDCEMHCDANHGARANARPIKLKSDKPRCSGCKKLGLAGSIRRDITVFPCSKTVGLFVTADQEACDDFEPRHKRGDSK